MDKYALIPFSEPAELADVAGKRLREHRNCDDNCDKVIPIDRVDYRIARKCNDFCGAFRLLQRRYVQAGLATGSSERYRVMPYHLWDETEVFVAECRGQVIGSVSLTRDGHPGGIPMEPSYGSVIREMRERGQSFGEVCSLTVDSHGQQSTGEIFGQLTRIMMFYSRQAGLDYLVAVVHPRHAKFYQRAMGFELIGESKGYSYVGGQPGIPILGRVNDRSGYRNRWQKFYFDGEYSADDLRPHRMPAEDIAYFEPFLPSQVRSSTQFRAA